ncbi:MAG TPA: pitrilysin family protein [Kofleriaceae bacterium]|nr:pitrilysin family protein [Kofleriaceae bacterium]
MTRATKRSTTRTMTGAALSLSLATSLLAAPALAQTRPAVEPPTSAPRVERSDFALPNGLAVTLIPTGDIPKTTVQLVFRAGNVDEAASEVWLADLAGQLVQLGTDKLDARAMDRTVAGWGGEITVDVRNDSTWIGGTVLGEFAPALIGLVGDLVQHPRFPASELPRLRGDLVRELNLASSQPGQQANAKLAAAMYPDQAYGRFFPTEAALRGYTLEQARAWFDRNLTARRAHLYVAGRFDAAAVERAIKEAFTAWPAGEPAPAREVKPVTRRVIHFVERTGAVQSTLRLGLPVVAPGSPDYVPLTIMNAVLGGSFASRITQNLREKRGYTYSPFAAVNVRDGDAYWAQNADVTSAHTGDSIREVLKEIDLLRRTPPGADELDAVKMGYVGRFIIRLGTREGVLNWEQFADFYGLPRDFDMVAAVQAVTADDVRRMARKYIDPRRLTIVVVGDGKTVLPQLKGIARVAK